MNIPGSTGIFVCRVLANRLLTEAGRQGRLCSRDFLTRISCLPFILD
jgi:hypothetical protein